MAFKTTIPNLEEPTQSTQLQPIALNNQINLD